MSNLIVDPRKVQEELLLLAEESAKRKADDPWWGWNPSPWQAPFVKDVLTGQVEEAWAFCANRTGKSDACAWIGASLARYGQQCPRFESPNPLVFDGPTTGWIVSTTHKNSVEVIQPKIFDNHLGMDPGHLPFIPDREIEDWNVTNQILILKNGSKIGFQSADGKAIKMAGASKDWIMFDEEPPQHIYNEAVIRVAAGRRLLVMGACTLLPPEGQTGGVTWMYNEKIKPWKNDPSSVPWKIYTASIYENPHLDPAEIRRLESIYPEGSASRAIRLNGELLAGLGGSRAYPSFNSQLHVIPQSEPTWRRPLCWLWDFNVEPLITLIGQRQGDTFHIFRELVIDDSASIQEMCDYFKQAYPQHGGEIWIYGDATGRARHSSTGRSEYQLIANEMRSYGMPVRIKVPESNPLVNDRVNAVNSAFRDEFGTPRIEIDPSCTELIDDFEQVLRDNRQGIKKTHNRRDPYVRRTHSSDAFGYWIAYERPVRLTPTPEMERMRRNAIAQPSYGFSSKKR